MTIKYNYINRNTLHNEKLKRDDGREDNVIVAATMPRQIYRTIKHAN